MTRGPRRGHPCGVGCREGVMCARHRPRTTVDRVAAVRTTVFQPPQPVPLVVPEPEPEYTGPAITDTCSICLDNVTFPAPDGARTPCGHVYHTACLAMVRGNKCPNCRGSLGRPEPPPQPPVRRGVAMIFMPPPADGEPGSPQQPINLTVEPADDGPDITEAELLGLYRALADVIAHDHHHGMDPAHIDDLMLMMAVIASREGSAGAQEVG